MTHPHPDKHKPELFIDNQPYDWRKQHITGSELRTLGALPEDVQIFHKVPGKPDQPVMNDTVIDLAKIPGPDHFSTQPVGSQAGDHDAIVT